MKYDTRLRLRAVYHSFKLFGAGIVGNKDRISQYIEVHGNPNDLHVCHNGHMHNGEIIYLIREAGGGYGFFAEFKLLLENLAYADKLGLVPCVRFGTDYLYYDQEIKEQNNPFEYYFDPIGEDINCDKALNIVYSKPEYGFSIEYVDDPNSDLYHMTESLTEIMVTMIRKYINIRQDIRVEFERKYQELCGDHSGRVLGVHYRGTDFKPGYTDHPAMVTLEQIKTVIEKELQEDHYDIIFLATDDENAYKELKDKFGNRIVCCEDVKRSEGNISVAFSEADRRAHHYKLGLEVLRDMYLLSRCDALICGLSQVSSSANLFKLSRGETYTMYHIIDNGVNKNRNHFSKTI